MEHIKRQEGRGALWSDRDWYLQELVLTDDRGVSREYVVSGAIVGLEPRVLKRIRNEMKQLRAAGVPPNRQRGRPEMQPWSGRCPGEHHDTTFLVLKAKPTGWRFYATVDHALHVITFLYAVQKKTDARDPNDFPACCHRLRILREGAPCAPLDLLLDQ